MAMRRATAAFFSRATAAVFSHATATASASAFSRLTHFGQSRRFSTFFSNECYFVPYLDPSRGYYPEPPDFYRLAPPVNLGVNLVPFQTVYIVERYDKYYKTLHSGLHFLNPLIDKITHVHSLQEHIIFPRDLQFRTSNDSVIVTLGYVLHLKIVDPLLATYGVEHPLLAARNVMEDRMISEILSMSSITLDKLLELKTSLCEIVMRAANANIATWGVKCVRCHLGLVSICPKVSLTEMRTMRLLRVLKI